MSRLALSSGLSIFLHPSPSSRGRTGKQSRGRPFAYSKQPARASVPSECEPEIKKSKGNSAWLADDSRHTSVAELRAVTGGSTLPPQHKPRRLQADEWSGDGEVQTWTQTHHLHRRCRRRAAPRRAATENLPYRALMMGSGCQPVDEAGDRPFPRGSGGRCAQLQEAARANDRRAAAGWMCQGLE